MTSAARLFGARRAPDGERVLDNFQRWFDQSKVVDAAGDPLVVFHGSRADVEVFSARRATKQHPNNALGFFFTTSPQVASDFAGEGAGACVMPVFLRVANPYRMTAGEWALLQDCEGPKAVRLFKAEKEALGHDGLVNFSGTQFVAFRADQVKSALGNSGLFLNGPKLSDKPGDVEAAALRARLLVELENGQRLPVKRLARV